MRFEGMHRGSMLDRNGDPVDSGPAPYRFEDVALTPLLRTPANSVVASLEEKRANGLDTGELDMEGK
jgi:hypothetical protein